jgi:hypothetical protein
VVAEELHVLRAAQVHENPAEEPPWLIEPLWGAGAVGIIGGAPKSCKTWLALEMAVAVASGRPCLGRFPVPRPGPVLLFAAEDAPPQIKRRIESLAHARQTDFPSLDVRLIVEPSLRLDLAQDLGRLRLTLEKHRPLLLVLDPYVRLQRADENDARQVSAILSALRELSRTFQTAVALVHHARKTAAELPGQALRGSGDFWAWGDSNLYVARKRDGLLLTVEHRCAASPAPIGLRLLTPRAGDQSPVRLEVYDNASSPDSAPLAECILAHLRTHGPTPHRSLRATLHVRDAVLSEALRALEVAGRLVRTSGGWRLSDMPSLFPKSLSL